MSILGQPPSLIWQAILVWVIWLFRADLQDLIARISSIKHGDTELGFQEPSSDEFAPSDLASKAMDLRDEEGFFRQDAICQIVSDSSYLQENEKVRDSMLVYRTRLQRTWLVVTNRQVFYVLDDENTRASQRLIQVREPLKKDQKIEANMRRQRTGNFKLGGVGPWLYSVDLLGPPSTAKLRLTRLIKEAIA